LVAFNTRWQAPEVADFLKLTEPRFALVSERYRDIFHSAMPAATSLEDVLTLGPDGSTANLALLDSSGRSLRATSGAPEVELTGGDVISFISTSGTTGRPKAVMQTHGNYVLTGEGYAHWIELRQGERIYLCLPLFHINAQAYSLMTALAHGFSLALTPKFHASTFWRDAHALGVTSVNVVGAMLEFLAAQPESQRGQPSRSVRLSPPEAGRSRHRRAGFVIIDSTLAPTED